MVVAADELRAVVTVFECGFDPITTSEYHVQPVAIRSAEDSRSFDIPNIVRPQRRQTVDEVSETFVDTGEPPNLVVSLDERIIPLRRLPSLPQIHLWAMKVELDDPKE